jgi:hypothetical protein
MHTCGGYDVALLALLISAPFLCVWVPAAATAVPTRPVCRPPARQSQVR